MEQVWKPAGKISFSGNLDLTMDHLAETPGRNTSADQ
jgi:hypothetical protein